MGLKTPVSLLLNGRSRFPEGDNLSETLEYNIKIECSKAQFLALVSYAEQIGIEVDLGEVPR